MKISFTNIDWYLFDLEQAIVTDTIIGPVRAQGIVHDEERKHNPVAAVTLEDYLHSGFLWNTAGAEAATPIIIPVILHQSLGNPTMDGKDRVSTRYSALKGQLTKLTERYGVECRLGILEG